MSKLKAAKPRTQKTLRSTLQALFKQELSEEQRAGLFAALCERGIVKIAGPSLPMTYLPGPNLTVNRTRRLPPMLGVEVSKPSLLR